MGTILGIILVFVCIGAALGFFGGKDGEKSATAVAGGLHAGCASTGCLLQLMLYVIPIALGLWLLGLLFG